jgi:hypothetical protein
VILASVYGDGLNRTLLTADIGGTEDFQNTYAYDDLYRLTQVKQEDNGGNAVADKRVDFAYNALSQFTGIARYQSLDTSELVVTSAYAYDLANRLTALDHSSATPALLVGYDFAYDAANRITQIVNSLDGTSDFTYDVTNQLTDADHSFQTDEEYEHDDNGNRIGGDYDTDPDNQRSQFHATAMPPFWRLAKSSKKKQYFKSRDFCNAAARREGAERSCK